LHGPIIDPLYGDAVDDNAIQGDLRMTGCATFDPIYSTINQTLIVAADYHQTSIGSALISEPTQRKGIGRRWNETPLIRFHDPGTGYGAMRKSNPQDPDATIRSDWVKSTFQGKIDPLRHNMIRK
jgi:hypothetical protein